MPEASLKIAQSEKYQGDDWGRGLYGWKALKPNWNTLHPTFRDPVRQILTGRNKFKLSTEGWGVCPVYARVFRKDGTSLRLRHQLALHYPEGTQNVK